MRKVYLDHNATTPARPEAIAAIQPFLGEMFGNPSSLHFAGREVRKAMEDAREKIASFFGCLPPEVLFTSSGTESDNLAIKGTAYRPGNEGKHIVTSQVEHKAVISTCRFLEKRGYRVTYVPVNRQGIVEPDAVRKAIEPDTMLVSIMAANNETGCVMPIAEIGEIARNAGALMHTDAVQATGRIPLDWNNLPVDMLTFSGHKNNALKGAGGLILRKGVKISSIIHGGRQEMGLRGGTENIVGIVSMGASFSVLKEKMDSEAADIRRLRDKLENGINERVPDVILNGHPTQRLPNTLNVSFRYVEGESVLLHLDMLGIACSTGSACSSNAIEASLVLRAMGMDTADAKGALRFSLGYGNTDEDISYTIDALEKSVGKLRAISPLHQPRKT